MIKKAVIASGLSNEASEYLKKIGIELLSFPCNISVDKRISHHSDISFFFDGNETLYIAKEMSIYADKLKLFCKNIVILDKCLGDRYPYDVALNCVCVGNNFICNKDTVSRQILDIMNSSGYNIIDVRQGYTKCSVVPVADNALITDDDSIFAECIGAGIDVLKISKGSIILNGFSYGFIGGTAGKISENEILFNGNISNHSDYKNIDRFLKKHNITAVGFSDTLEDIGSIIPLFKT